MASCKVMVRSICQSCNKSWEMEWCEKEFKWATTKIDEFMILDLWHFDCDKDKDARGVDHTMKSIFYSCIMSLSSRASESCYSSFLEDAIMKSIVTNISTQKALTHTVRSYTKTTHLALLAHLIHLLNDFPQSRTHEWVEKIKTKGQQIDAMNVCWWYFLLTKTEPR